MLRLLTSAVALGLLTAACQPGYYIPNTQNVPLLTARNQKTLTLAGNGNQYELQGAYSLTDHLAFQLNTGLVKPKDLDNGDGGSGKFFEAGVGYYAPLKNNFTWATYFLAGAGSMENHFPSEVSANPVHSGNISANIFRYGLQPVVGYESKYFSIGASSRILSLNYNNIKGDLIYKGENQKRYLEDNRSGFLLEPALTLRGGIEPVKLQIQWARSINLSNTSFRQENTLLSLGLHLSLR